MKNKISGLDKNTNIAYVLTVLAVQLISILMLTKHEYWCDETQIWQLSKYNDIIGLYKACETEGHPMLYSIIVKFIQLFTDNVISLSILNTVAIITAEIVFLYYLPGRTWIKVIASFGFQLLYYNAVNGRPYGLITLCIVVVFATYLDREKHPYRYYISLVILQQTHIYLWQFIGILWILGVVDTYKIINVHGIKQKKSKDNILGMLLYSIGIVWLLVQLAGIGVTQQSNQTLLNQLDIGKIGQCITSILSPLYIPMLNVQISSIQSIVQVLLDLGVADLRETFNNRLDAFCTIIMIIQSFQYLMMTYITWIRNKRLAIIQIIQLEGQALINNIIFTCNISRLALQILIVLVCYMIADVNKDNVSDSRDSALANKIGIVQFMMLCIWQIIINIIMMYVDMVYPYGLGQAQFNSIAKHVNQEDTVVLVDDNQTAQVAQILQYKYNKPIVQISSLQEYTYADWQTCIQINNMAVDQLKDNAESCLSKYTDCVFIYIAKDDCDIPENIQAVFEYEDISGYTYGITATYSGTDRVYLLSLK